MHLAGGLLMLLALVWGVRLLLAGDSPEEQT
jgi:hypothetical protein